MSTVLDIEFLSNFNLTVFMKATAAGLNVKAHSNTSEGKKPLKLIVHVYMC